MSVLQKPQLNAIYQDMLARLDMGLLYDENGEVEAESFCNNLREAILEKLPEEDRPEQMDSFSVAFGAVSERILRQLYDNQGKEWW